MSGDSGPLSPEPAPAGLSTFDVGSYLNLGPAIALLDERIAAQSAGPLVDQNRYDWSFIGRHFTADQLAHSAIETAVALSLIVGTRSLLNDDPDTKPTNHEAVTEAARILATLGQSFTRLGHRRDATEADLCREQARLCHELAAYFLTGNGRPLLTITDTDLDAVYNVAFALLDMAARLSGTEYHDQLELLRLQSARAQTLET